MEFSWLFLSSSCREALSVFSMTGGKIKREPTMEILELKGVTKAFGGLTAVKDSVSFFFPVTCGTDRSQWLRQDDGL